MPSKRFVPILRFSVGTSYSEKCAFEEKESLQKIDRFVDNRRQASEKIAQAFARLSSAEDTAERHQFTKPCHHVVRDPHGNFSTCTNPNCRYAHTLDELRMPCCVFDQNCFRRPSVNKNLAPCRFKHSEETKEQFIQRMNIVVPDLPQTKEEPVVID